MKQWCDELVYDVANSQIEPLPNLKRDMNLSSCSFNFWRQNVSYCTFATIAKQEKDGPNTEIC